VLTRPGRLDELTVQVEAASDAIADVERTTLARVLAERVKKSIGVTITVDVVDPYALQRSLGKAKRIDDQRGLR